MDTSDFDEFVLENFGGVVFDHPWESDPEFTVFRHGDNRKWFALRFFASKEQLLKLKSDDSILNTYGDGEKIDIVNIKIEPEMIPDMIKIPGVLLAFHMSRKHWISVLLDSDVEADKTKPLIEMSYNLTSKIYRRFRES